MSSGHTQRSGRSPTSFHIFHLLEIVEKHKKAADLSVSTHTDLERDSTRHDKIKVFCSEHEGMKMELYCETCGDFIYWKCALRGGKHQSHDYKELDKAFEKYKVEITASLEPMEKQLITTNEALAQLHTRYGEIYDQQSSIKADIQNTFRKIQLALDTRKTELIGQLHHFTQRKLKCLAAQRDQLETIQTRISSCLGFLKESLRTGSPEEVLSTKTTVVKQVKELTTTFPPDTLKPSTEADMVFSVAEGIATACQSYGLVSTLKSPNPSKCHAIGRVTVVAVVGEMSTAELQAIDYRDQPCEKPVMSLEAELVSELTGIRIRGSIERIGQSQYEISYQPTIKGRHQLHIRVEGQHIRGSPFIVWAKSPFEKLGTPIQTFKGVRKPCDVAINQRGELIITEYGGHCVSVFSPNGEKLRSFGTLGSGKGEFELPCGVALDNDGNMHSCC